MGLDVVHVKVEKTGLVNPILVEIHQVYARNLRQVGEKLVRVDVLVGEMVEQLRQTAEEERVAHVAAQGMDDLSALLVGVHPVGMVLRHVVQCVESAVLLGEVHQRAVVLALDVVRVGVEGVGVVEPFPDHRLGVVGEALVDPHLLGTLAGDEVAEPVMEQLVAIEGDVGISARHERLGIGDIGSVLHGTAGEVDANIAHAGPAVGSEELLIHPQDILQVGKRGPHISILWRLGVDDDGDDGLLTMEGVLVGLVLAHRHRGEVRGDRLLQLPRPHLGTVGERLHAREHAVTDSHLVRLSADMGGIARLVGEDIHTGIPAAAVAMREALEGHAHSVGILARKVEATPPRVLGGHAVVIDGHHGCVARLHCGHRNGQSFAMVLESGRGAIHLHRVGRQGQQIQDHLVQVGHFGHNRQLGLAHDIAGREIHHSQRDVIMGHMDRVTTVLGRKGQSCQRQHNSRQKSDFLHHNSTMSKGLRRISATIVFESAKITIMWIGSDIFHGWSMNLLQYSRKQLNTS